MNEIQDHMKHCEGFDVMYCSDDMCPQCPQCDKNIALEWFKQHDICPKCYGIGLFSGLSRGFVSVTRLCNLCAGNGRCNHITMLDIQDGSCN